MISSQKGLRPWRQRLSALFQDHEIFIRTHGQVRFLRFTAKMQKRVIGAALIILLAWAGMTLAMIGNQLLTANDRVQITQQQAAAAAAEKRIAAYRGAIEEMASDLDQRQMQLEEWQKSYFSNEILPTPLDGAAPARKTSTAIQIGALNEGAAHSDLPPEVRRLIALAARQESLSAELLTAVNARAANAELAVTKLGLNPKALVRSASSARGGPFIPYRAASGKAKSLGASFAALEQALFRMEVLERTLVAVPSGKPADVMMLSSSFGYRSDPFTRAGAMHSGLDFPGPVGTPILSAAPGRVTFVGTKSGYGSVIEVDHGQGIMTRYAHLSGYTTKVGSRVAAGQQIGKMGSTGRSTGSHLHFEVRLHGAAVNPRRFLDAKADILEVKADASERVGAITGRAI